MLDPTPARALPREILELASIVTPNQSEMATILHAENAAPSNFAEGIEAAQRLRQIGARDVVLKMAELGCLWVGESKTVTAKGFAVKALDTTAAGDTFNAALAVMISRGWALEDALNFANAAAALSVTRAGAQSSIPSLAEVQAFLGEANRIAVEEVRR